MIITKKYHSNLVTERRAHWSLKLGVACYPVTLHVNKKNTSGSSFFKAQASILSLTA